VRGYVDLSVWIFLIVAFLPSMALMKVFGSNKVVSIKRMLKWYMLGTLFLCAFFMQFFDIREQHIHATANNTLFDFIALSLLGGILLARKGAFGRQKQRAKEYHSRRLMELLGYEEQGQ
ncbi:hypothetical protein, partial [Alteromonas sp. 14N.309.X.WAT.G.H12]|uniref:hypothetical protein n=1 Tax=Alteromonas sp. 14N.309.X.WAT.G.H12 TaxID=3120824 RepID=UPI002FD60029